MSFEIATNHSYQEVISLSLQSGTLSFQETPYHEAVRCVFTENTSLPFQVLVPKPTQARMDQIDAYIKIKSISELIENYLLGIFASKDYVASLSTISLIKQAVPLRTIILALCPHQEEYVRLAMNSSIALTIDSLDSQLHKASEYRRSGVHYLTSYQQLNSANVLVKSYDEKQKEHLELIEVIRTEHPAFPHEIDKKVQLHRQKTAASYLWIAASKMISSWEVLSKWAKTYFQAGSSL